MNAQAKYALLWVDEYYTPGIKFFATLAEAEEARGKTSKYIVEVKLEEADEMSTDQIREEMDREERCNLAGVPYVRPSELD